MPLDGHNFEITSTSTSSLNTPQTLLSLLYRKTDSNLIFYIDGNGSTNICLDLTFKKYLSCFSLSSHEHAPASALAIQTIKVEGSTDGILWDIIYDDNYISPEALLLSTNKKYSKIRFSAYSGSKWAIIDGFAMYFTDEPIEIKPFN